MEKTFIPPFDSVAKDEAHTPASQRVHEITEAQFREYLSGDFSPSQIDWIWLHAHINHDNPVQMAIALKRVCPHFRPERTNYVDVMRRFAEVTLGGNRNTRRAKASEVRRAGPNMRTKARR